MAIELTTRFIQALEYMYKLHGKKTRKETEIPVVSHLMATATTVIEFGRNEDEVIAALLHDAAEDEGGHKTLAEIKDKFGKRVADIVEGCSDTLEINKPPWKPRKERYIEKLKKCEDPSIILVSIADKLHNTRAIIRDYKNIGEVLWERFNADRDEIINYYKSLLDVYRDKMKDKSKVLVDELEQNMIELKSLIA